MTVTIVSGEALDELRKLPADSVHACVTSPPYYAQRSYGGLPNEIGSERSVTEYLARLIEVFAEVRRVLRPDGVAWVVIGDTYCSNGGASGALAATGLRSPSRAHQRRNWGAAKRKDLIGIPWLFAFAMRDELGWWLRGDHVWGKPNSMPDSTEDRPGRAHEYVFLFSKSARYWFDHRAVRTAPKADSVTRLARAIRSEGETGVLCGGAYAPPGQQPNVKARRDAETSTLEGTPYSQTPRSHHKQSQLTDPPRRRGHARRHVGFNERWDAMERAKQQMDGANLRSVWWVSPAQYPGDHFAVMPDLVAEICIRSGCPEGGVVRDPFFGTGVTGAVAAALGRQAIGIELNPRYVQMARERCGLFAEVA